MTAEQKHRVASRTRWLQITAAILLGTAIFGMTYRLDRIALAAAIGVLFLQLFAIEGLRLSTQREKH